MRPSDKVTTAAVAGALTVLVTWLLKTYWHQDIAPEAQASLSVLIGVILAYFVPEGHPAPSAVDTVLDKS